MNNFSSKLHKTIPLILIVLISLNTFGFNLVLEYLLYSCKVQFEEYAVDYLSEEDITIFKLSELDKNKLGRYDDEIKYADHMYDVVKEETKNGDVFIYCVQDKKEDELNNILNKQNSNQKYPLKLNHLIKNLTKIYINPPKTNKLFSDYIQFNTLESHSYISHYIEVLPPPPDFIV